jgi:aminoglycoside 3-N-acetyltransferase I
MSPLPLDCVRAVRLRPGDRDIARQLYAALAEVFEESASPPSDATIDRLLCRDDFWAVAAFVGEELAGGVTAHTLPMSRSDGSELFIYDVAVRRRYQRMGVGRQLLETTCQLAAQVGIHLSFVLAENMDTHALDFYRALGATESSVTLFTFERN